MGEGGVGHEKRTGLSAQEWRPQCLGGTGW